MLRKVLSYSLMILSNCCYAGINGLTIHSRANCAGNNESISWDKKANHVLRVVSTHMNLTKGTQHTNDTGFINTWRAAVVHWSEAVNSGAWVVTGSHWEYFPRENRTVFLGSETVAGCSIYNGWWE